MKFLLMTMTTLVFLSGIASAQFKDNNSPCRPLRLACESAGFTLNNAKSGNKLIKDCLVKLATGQSATSSVTGRVAQAPAGADIQSCAGKIHRGKKPTVGMRSKNVVQPSAASKIVK